jgi:cilia- and flagella-associated protein 65
MKISAIGKFPFLKVSSKRFMFGELLYGKRAVKKMIIKNVSEVGTKFHVEKNQDDEFDDKSFSLDVMSGFIPPKSSFLIHVRYKPMNWDLYSCSHFKLICEGGNTIDLDCSGQALSQSCRLSCSFVNFGEIKIGANTSRMISLHNDSDTHCVYEVICDNKNIFGIVDNVGIIKPKSYSRLYLTFKPQKTINYYQRIHVLVRNH